MHSPQAVPALSGHLWTILMRKGISQNLGQVCIFGRATEPCNRGLGLPRFLSHTPSMLQMAACTISLRHLYMQGMAVQFPMACLL